MALHHKIPRSRGGSDDEWNLEELSPFQHAYEHALDFVLFPEISPMFDFRQEGWKLLPEDLQTECRKEVARRQRIKGKLMVGSRNGRYQKGIMKDVPKSEEHKQKLSESQKGVPRPYARGKRSEETKRKMSESRKVRVQCPHCDMIGGISQMKRYHFNNCKNK